MNAFAGFIDAAIRQSDIMPLPMMWMQGQIHGKVCTEWRGLEERTMEKFKYMNQVPCRYCHGQGMLPPSSSTSELPDIPL